MYVVVIKEAIGSMASNARVLSLAIGFGGIKNAVNDLSPSMDEFLVGFGGIKNAVKSPGIM